MLIRNSIRYGAAAPPVLTYLPTGMSKTAVQANGMRLMVSGYAGPLVRLCRSSDNVELDFYPNAFGRLDRAAVAAWTIAGGAGVAYVKTCYDQSGNANHFTSGVDNTSRMQLLLGTDESMVTGRADGTKGADVQPWPNQSTMAAPRRLIIPTTATPTNRNDMSVFLGARQSSNYRRVNYFEYGDITLAQAITGDFEGLDYVNNRSIADKYRNAGANATSQLSGAESISGGSQHMLMGGGAASIYGWLSSAVKMRMYCDGAAQDAISGSPLPSLALTLGGQWGLGHTLSATGATQVWSEQIFLVSYNGALTTVEFLSVNTALRTIFNTMPAITSRLLIVGDSIMESTSAYNLQGASKKIYDSLNAGVKINNFAQAGLTAAGAAGTAGTGAGSTFFDPGFTKRFPINGMTNVCYSNLGINDITDVANYTPAQILASLENLADISKTNGGFQKFVQGTICDRNALSAPNLQKIIDTNALIKANTNGKFDAVADVQAILAAVATPANTTYYETDGLHHREPAYALYCPTIAAACASVGAV